MKLFLRWSAWLAAALVFTSCKSGPPEGMPPELREEAYRFFGHQRVEFFWVPSGGSVADATFSAVAATGPSRLGLQLAAIMERGNVRQVDLCVSGPNSAKVRRVITDALSQQVTRLPKLYLLYIGDPKEVPAIEKATADWNVRLYYVARQPGAAAVPPGEPPSP